MRLLALTITLLSLGSGVSAIEEPKFEIVKKFEEFEVRNYSPFIIAEVTITGSFSDAGNQAFRILFDYIQGNNSSRTRIEMTAPVNQQSGNQMRTGEKIEMTAPVIQTSSESTGSYLISFVMPAKFSLETTPIPNDPRVKIREVNPGLVAVRKYRGSWGQDKYLQHEKELLNALSQAGYQANGTPVFARYDPPFMPPFLRRNEILIPISEVTQP